MERWLTWRNLLLSSRNHNKQHKTMRHVKTTGMSIIMTFRQLSNVKSSLMVCLNLSLQACLRRYSELFSVYTNQFQCIDIKQTDKCSVHHFTFLFHAVYMCNSAYNMWNFITQYKIDKWKKFLNLIYCDLIVSMRYGSLLSVAGRDTIDHWFVTIELLGTHGHG